MSDILITPYPACPVISKARRRARQIDPFCTPRPVCAKAAAAAPYRRFAFTLMSLGVVIFPAVDPELVRPGGQRRQDGHALTLFTGRRPRRRRRRCRRPERPRRACWPTSPLRRRACCCNVGGQERPLLGRWRSPGPLVTRSSRRREVCGSHDRQPTVPVCSTACGRPPGDSQRGRPCRRALASPARHGIRTAPRRRGGSRMPAPGRYQRPWITVPLCNVTTFLALPVQSMKAGRSRQVSRASLQCSTTPAGDA